jgi:hypothetical protein
MDETEIISRLLHAEFLYQCASQMILFAMLPDIFHAMRVQPMILMDSHLDGFQ